MWVLAHHVHEGAKLRIITVYGRRKVIFIPVWDLELAGKSLDTTDECGFFAFGGTSPMGFSFGGLLSPISYLHSRSCWLLQGSPVKSRHKPASILEA